MKNEVVFSSVDGVANLLTVFPVDNQGPVLLIAPAMGVPARTYLKLAEALQTTGHSAATFDLRGIGNSAIRASRANNFGYYQMAIHDFSAAVAALKNELPNRPIVLLGHSMGGQLACLFLSQNPNAAAGLILSASCTVHYAGWPFPQNMSILVLSQIAALIARVVGYFPGKKLGFGGREARNVMIDWARNARNGRYKLLNSAINFESDLKKVSLPILAINFNDDRFAPLTATQLLLDKLDSHDISYLAINAGQLEQNTADHFNWVQSPTVMARKLSNWLTKTHF